MKFFMGLLVVGLLVIGMYRFYGSSQPQEPQLAFPVLGENEGGEESSVQLHPLQIEYITKYETPGSELVIEQELEPGNNYSRSLASYRSDGLKIFGLLTVPKGTKPEVGWPAILFMHGYIPPAQYRTTERYIAYVDGFAKNGYVVFKPDLRGHGNSEGEPGGAYGSAAYMIDSLNALASVKKLKAVNPDRIGMWGHSMGGYLTLRTMVVRPDVKAGVIWAGVVGSYQDLIENWRRRLPTTTPSGIRRWRQELIEKFGLPAEGNPFWQWISSNSYVGEISGPVQLHHGTTDASVPQTFSVTLKTQLEAQGKAVELYLYPGDDHNLSQNFSTAMRRSVEFFDRTLKI